MTRALGDSGTAWTLRRNGETGRVRDWIEKNSSRQASECVEVPGSSCAGSAAEGS